MSIDILLELDNVNKLQGGWPEPASLDVIGEAEGSAIADELESPIKQLLSSTDASQIASAITTLFHREGFWRDLVALTWSIRTFYTADLISEKLAPLIVRSQVDPASITLDRKDVSVIPLPNKVSVVRLPFTFKTANPATTCSLAIKVVRLRNGQLKVFTVTSALAELSETPWKPVTASGKAAPAPTELPSSTDVIVIGGGHGGLAISAYLKSLGVEFALLEKTPTIGDGWSQRYDSATLHTTRIFSGLPMFPFPDDYPEYVPASLIAKHYRSYVEQLDLPAFASTEVKGAVFDEAAKEWTVTVNQKGAQKTIQAKNLVFCIGVGGRFPITPVIPGQDIFKGEQRHSIAYTNASGWKGKKVAVIGSSTTACDVCHDCSRLGIDVTMVQRGPTRIYPAAHIESVQKMFWNKQFGADGGDVMAGEDPTALQAPLSALLLENLRAAHDPEYYLGLERAGFLAATQGAIHQQIFCQAGRHYPDIGACQAISAGEIKVKSGSLIKEIVEDGIVFENGSKLDADVILYATGFEKDVRSQVSSIVGQKITAQLEPVWGLSPEGEVRGAWRPTGHSRIWFQCGELQTMRMYGKYLALQVAAEVKGVRPEPMRS